MPSLRVEVVYARADAQQVVSLELPIGSTVREAVQASGLEVPPEACYGRFGRRVADSEQLGDGDRIEVLRPLRMDPKEARRRRGRKRP